MSSDCGFTSYDAENEACGLPLGGGTTHPTRAQDCTMPSSNVLHDVTVRATVDLEFRKRLLADPNRTILEEYGVTIPSGHKILFIEKPKGVDTLIVLPDHARVGDELDED